MRPRRHCIPVPDAGAGGKYARKVPAQELQLFAGDRVMQAAVSTFDMHIKDNILPHLVGARSLMAMDALGREG